MKYPVFVVLAPFALLLSACTSVEPAYKDIGTRNGPCIDGGPDSVAQQFYNLRLQQPSQGLPDATLLSHYRPYLSNRLYQELQQAAAKPQKNAELQGDLFSSLAAGPTAAQVSDASTIPNTDAYNIPLRVSLSRRNNSTTTQWQDEVQMIREGTCWTVNDVRYLGLNPHISGGSLLEQLER